MHMPDILVAHPAVFGTTLATAGAAVALATRNLRAQESIREKVPLMGVLGAFVFAGQMVNFSLPGLGVSGHLGGAALLTAVLGPSAAIVVMAAVLGIQCMLFQDGGLLALGANLINMAVIPALTTSLSLRVTSRWLPGLGGLLLGTAVGAWIGLVFAASLVPVEAALSGALPSGVGVTFFAGVMLGVHVLIGLGEAAISVGVLVFLYRVRPGLLPALSENHKGRPRPLRLVAVGLALSLLVGAGMSQLASPHEDGLEHAMAQVGIAEALPDSGPSAAAAELVETTSLLADYERFPGIEDPRVALALAGTTGTLLVFALLYGMVALASRRSLRT